MIPYSVTFEWLCSSAAIVRVHHGPNAHYGDPYAWWTVLKVSGQSIEIKGADRPLPREAMKVLCDSLRAAGYTHRLHRRRQPDGSFRCVTKDL